MSLAYTMVESLALVRDLSNHITKRFNKLILEFWFAEIRFTFAYNI